MGLSSTPETRSAGITRKGLPDFKGNSQNFESAEEAGRVLSGLQWVPRRQGRGLAGRAAWSVWPGRVQSEGHRSQLFRIRDGGPPGPARRHLPLTAAARMSWRVKSLIHKESAQMILIKGCSKGRSLKGFLSGIAKGVMARFCWYSGGIYLFCWGSRVKRLLVPG